MTKLLLIAAPIGALAVYVLWRAVRGRPLSRFALNLVVALYLLVYLLVTAGLGIFWVARMDLPAFDLHYLFGYCVVLLATIHVALQLKILVSWIRRVSPKALLERGGGAFRPAVRLVAGAVAAAALLGPVVALLLSRPRAEPARLQASVPAPDSRSEAGAAVPRIFIERGAERIDAIDYMHEQSSYSRSGLARSVPVVTRRPDDVKAYPGSTRVVLPAPRTRAGISLGGALERRASSFAHDEPAAERIVSGQGDAAGMPLGALAEILQFSAGVTSNKAASAGLSLRAAASSGALFPTDVYVAARRVQGLSSGLYYYHPREHALFELGGGGLVDRIADSLPYREREAPVSFVLGVTFDRTVYKYNIRSYRYVALDTGHLATNLGLSAAALGWSCRLEPSFDDEALAQAISADPAQEGGMAVLVCGPAGRQSAPLATPAAEPVSLPERADETELTRLSHRLTSWRLVRDPGVKPAPSLLAAEPAPVERYTPVEQDVFEAIASRRSYREFAADPLERDELFAILRDSVELAPRIRGRRLNDLYLVVRAVAGLAPGVYRREPGGRLEPLASGDRSAQIESAGLSQELLGRAAVVLVWTLSRAAGAIDGPRDYRNACLEAGLSGENAYLSATARGLGICGVGAFYDDEVNALLEHGGVRPRALYLQGIGRR